MNVLMIDDDTTSVEALKVVLEEQQPEWSVAVADDATSALAMLARGHTDLVLMDIRLSSMDGIELLRRVRWMSSVPVIVLTAECREMLKVRAFRAGADDFVTKPFGALELVVRIEALLRRAGGGPRSCSLSPLTLGDITIETANPALRLGGRRLKLSGLEHKLICALASQPNRPISSDALLARVWGREYRGETNLLKVYIWRLRSKIEQDPSAPRRIVTEWGHGYKLVVASVAQAA